MRPSDRANDPRDGGRQAIPLRGLVPQSLPAVLGESVVLRAAVVFPRCPFGLDPALLLQLVERGIERTLADAQLVVRHLANTLGNGPAVYRLPGRQPPKQKA